MLKGRYNSIVQFHNAQPKGPGFIRQVQQKESAGKRESLDAVKSPDIEREGGIGWAKAPKRRSLRLSVSEDTPVQKKLRSSGQTHSPPPSEDSKGGSGSRYSRRIRRQQVSSISSPPSSPTSNQSTDEGCSPKLNSLRGRGREGSGRVGGGRRSGGKVTPPSNSNQKREEEEESAREEEEESEVGGRASPSKDEEGRSGERKDTTMNSMPQDSNVGGEGIRPHHPMHDPPQLMASHQLLPEEDNYTICHGTPRSRGSSAIDMSSPAAKAPPAVSRPSDMTSPVDNHSMPHPQTPTHPDATNLTPGGGAGRRDGGERDHSKLISPAGIAGLHGRDPMIAQHLHHDYHKEPNNWPAGYGPQFSGVPSGYYGHGIHPMHYPANPAARHVPHANYPFGVPYPWGHTMGPHSRTPESSQHHYAGQTDPSVLHARSVETSPSTQSFPHPPPPPPHMAYPHYLHSPHAAAHTPASSDGGKSPASIPSDTHVSSPSTAISSSSTSPTVMKNPSLMAPQAHHAQLSPHAALRQLSSPGSAQPSLPVHHAFSRPSHPLAPEHPAGPTAGHHPSSAPFAYGIDPNNPAALHMHPFWQHPQMQQHPMRPIPGVHPSHLPPHLQPAPGMWYTHPLMQGGVPEDPTKRRMQVPSPIPKHVDSAHLRMNTNRNNSNDVSVNVEVPSNQQSTSNLVYLTKNTSGQFSVEYLTSQEKSPLIHMASNQPPPYLTVVAMEDKSSQNDYAGFHDSANLRRTSAATNGQQHQLPYRNVLLMAEQDYAELSQQARQTEDTPHLSSTFPR